MIQVVTSENREAFAADIDAMFRLRHDVFVKELGWTLPEASDTHERDRFDGDDAIYLIARDGQGVAGSMRLLPTEGPHLMTEVFSFMCDGAVPRGANVWESTRSCVRRDRRGRDGGAKLTIELCAAMLEVALVWGIDEVSAIVPLQAAGAFEAWGFRYRPLGLPKPIGGTPCLAGAMLVSTASLSEVRRRNGLATPITEFRRAVRAA